MELRRELLDKDVVVMTNADDRGKGTKEAKASLNAKVHPDMVLGIANSVNEKHSGVKYITA